MDSFCAHPEFALLAHHKIGGGVGHKPARGGTQKEERNEYVVINWKSDTSFNFWNYRHCTVPNAPPIITYTN